MNWIVVVLIGHFLNAVSYVLDKVLLTKSIQNPFAFTFYIGVLGMLAVAFIPFGFEVPTTSQIVFNLITGALFILALLFFFLALSGSEASRITSFVGGSIPVLTLIFELLFLDERLSTFQLVAFTVLVAGTILIIIDFDAKKEKKEAFQYKPWLFGLLAGLSFAISFGMTKIAFDSQPFVSAFVWMRFGSLLLPLCFLLVPKHRKAIVSSFSIFKEKAGFLYLVAQGFGAVGFICINYAISLASVSLVNALQGTQYAFLLIMAVIGTAKYPKLLQESMSKKGLAVKVVAVVVIGAGLAMIAFK